MLTALLAFEFKGIELVAFTRTEQRDPLQISCVDPTLKMPLQK